jgi:hypothetical protein
MEEEVVERVVELADVVVVGESTVRGTPGAVAQALAQPVGRALQVDDDVRGGEVAGQQVVQALVDEQIFVV